MDRLKLGSTSALTIRDVPSLDSQIMDHRRRFLMSVILMTRHNFRKSLGLSLYQYYSRLVDEEMAKTVHSYANWAAYTAQGNSVFQTRSGSILAVEISSDGCHLYVGTDDTNSIIIYDLCKRRDSSSSSSSTIDIDAETDRFVAHKDAVSCLKYHSGLLVSGSFDRKVRVWNAHTYDLLSSLKGHAGVINCVEVSDNCTRIVSGSMDMTIRLWSVRRAICVRVFRGHTQSVNSVHFLDNCVIFSASSDQTCRMWSPVNGAALETVTEGVTEEVSEVCVNCDGSLLACMMYDQITVYRWPGMKVAMTTELTAFHGCFHPIIPDILAMDDGISIKIYRLNTGYCVRSLDGHQHTINDLCFSPDGCRLISVSEDETTRVWDVSELVVG